MNADAGQAEPLISTSYTTYGTPGLLEMPTAESAPDADLATTFAIVGNERRSTLTFQLHPRISGSFRYAVLPGYERNGTDRFDRSFDLRYRFLDEGRYWPALAIGLRDFIGTGVYSSEYLVATKSFGPERQLRISLGLGWGRLGTYGSIGETGIRTEEFEETGGTANLDQYFRGPFAPFGGVSWRLSDRLTLKAEYSSDGYLYEQERGIFSRESPWNFGFDYQVADAVTLQAGYLYGSEISVQLSFVLNPKKPVLGPGTEEAPIPVMRRPSRRSAPDAWATAWTTDVAYRDQIISVLADVLEETGLRLDGIRLGATAVDVRVANLRYGAEAQAIGRTARILTQAMPASVERFTIIPVADGVPSSSVTVLRQDIEDLENEPGAEVIGRAVIGDGSDTVLSAPLERPVGLYPNYDYAVAPYLTISLFDPDEPVRGEAGISFAGRVEPRPGWVVQGLVTQSVIGNLDEINRVSDSVLPRVRSDFALYLEGNGPVLQNLTLSNFGKLRGDVYTRLSFGYLERMYGGISAEVLWKPVNSRLGIGAEINYVQQRDFSGLGFQDYSVLTGHVSAYYDFGNGVYAQVDAGRYLAGDTGATFTLERVFRNGWRIGAFATFTDVPFEDFGEGSFDKGILLTIPLSWSSGQPSRTRLNAVLRPLTRDGGARLYVSDRLYERLRDSHGLALRDRSGRFWR